MKAIDISKLCQDLTIINRKCDVMTEFINTRKHITAVTRAELIKDVGAIQALVGGLLFMMEEKK